MRIFKHISILLVVLFTTLKAVGQNYPIQSFVQINPPYSSYLPDYADPFNNQMKILLTLTDFTVASHQVKIKVTLTGNGYTIATNDFLNLPPITVTPGVPIEISGNALAPYLATENLIFTGVDVNDYIQRKVLPEGPCSICVEVIDYTSPNNLVLGNPTCAQTWFARQQPPMLNQPLCGSNIQALDPQQILFNWTPMNMGGPTGLNTEYVFEIFENNSNPDDNIDPNQIVNSSIPIFFQVTSQTFVNYGIVEPQLQIGKEYIWRVQARNVEGRDLYANNGYSTVCTFNYGSLAASLADGIELQLQTSGTGVRQGYANWNANGVFTNYVLEVRKTGNEDFEWFPYVTTVGVPTTDMKINSLEPETEYEARIKGLINDEYESEYSNISVFTTNPPPNYACGTTTMPATQPNITPLDNAIVGMTFTVGQFDMRVTSIEALGQAGHFKGTGKITMPFIMMQLNVSFTNILVDDNLAIREGKVEAITKGVDQWEHDLLISMADPYSVPAMDTTMIQYDSTGVTINFEGADSTFTFPGGGVPIVLNAAGGIQYIVWPDGTIEIGTWNVSDDSLDATKDYFVYFEAAENQLYGFDAFNTSRTAWEGNYENILLEDGTPYYVSYKSTAKNAGDHVIAKLETNTPTDLTFTIGGVEISTDDITVIDDKTYDIDLSGYMQDLSKDLYVFDAASLKIGKLHIITYAEKNIDVVVVPVGNATINLPQLQDSLNAIYACANTSFNVSTASTFNDLSWDLNNDGKMQIDDPELFNLYSDEMKALRSSYFADTNYNKQAVYIFVINEFETPGVDGYMVHNKSLGFVSNNPTEHTIAHEIGHGAFDLAHTFPEVTKESTNNLMDYGGGNHLTKVQWEQIFSNQLSFSFLDDAEDNMAKYSGSQFYSTNENEISVPINGIDIDGIITPSGYAIIFANDASQNWILKNVKFDRESGGVSSFTLNNIDYISISLHYDNGAYTFITYMKKDGWNDLMSDYNVKDTTYKIGGTIPGEEILSYVNNHKNILLNWQHAYQNNSILTMLFNSDDCSFKAHSILYKEIYPPIKKPNNKFKSGNWQGPLNGYRDPLTIDEILIANNYTESWSNFIIDKNIYVSTSDNNLSELECRYTKILDKQKKGAAFLEKYNFNENYSNVFGAPLNNNSNIDSDDLVIAERMLDIAETYDAIDESYFWRVNDSRYIDAYIDAISEATFYVSSQKDFELQKIQYHLDFLIKTQQSIENILEEFETIKDEDRIARLFMDNPISESDLAKLSIETRVNLLDCFSKDWMWFDEERTALAIILSTPVEDATRMLDELIASRPITYEVQNYQGGTETITQYENLFSALFSRIDRDENNQIYMQVMYNLWVNSQYTNTENYNYEKDAAGNDVLIFDYVSEKIAGFHDSNYNLDAKVDFSEIYITKEKANIPITGNFIIDGIVSEMMLPEQKTYVFDPFQPIGIISYNQDGNVQFPVDGPIKIPAFILYAFDKINTNANIEFGAEIGIDIITTVIGLGPVIKSFKLGLTGISTLSKTQKIILGIKTIEFTAGATNIILKYTCEEENQLCSDIQSFLTCVELVSMSGDAIYGALAKHQAKELLKAKDEILKLNKGDEIVEVANKVANAGDALVSSIRARLITLKNPARPILEGEGIPLINGKFTKELGTNKFDNIITGNYGEASKKYIWTIDDNGINIGLEQTSIGNNSVIKHTNLSPKAYSGGEVWFTDIETVHVNAWSGRFGAGANMTKVEWEASIDAWKSLGYKVIIEPYTP